MTILSIDFETRGTVELRDCGVEVYSRDPNTDVICMAAAFDDEEPLLIDPRAGVSDDQFDRIAEHVFDGGEVHAWNAAFELAIWSNIFAPRYKWPRLDPEQCRCTMARSYAMGLPGSLDKAAQALGVAEQKDMGGHRLMLQMSKPRRIEADGTIVWWDDAERMAKLFAYCLQDVQVERAVSKFLRPLSDAEQQVWVLDQAINNRGVYVDLPTVKRAVEVVEAEKARLDGYMARVTGGAVAKCSEVAKLTAWVERQGIDLEGVAKADILALLEGPLPLSVRRALTLRQEAAKSSTAKLQAMIDSAGEGSRVRGMFQYHGASTGRWAGRRIQLQNLPRPTLDQPRIEEVLEVLDVGNLDLIDNLYGSVMSVVSSSVRAMLCAAPSRVLVAADYANIEGRVLAWLADEYWKIAAFREFDAGTGHDLYKLAYGRAFNIAPKEVTKDQRQVGKVMELALGYQGGVGAFQTMARGYGVRVSDERANELKEKWREAHPKIKAFWRNLQTAAIRATLQPGEVFSVGRIRYVRRGTHLYCQLPSGRLLTYPFPQMQTRNDGYPEALTYMGENSMTKKWERISTYGGKLAENVTQAVARDCLVEGLLSAERAGFPVVMHVHDEIVAEIPTEESDGATERFETAVTQMPSWAMGLPVVAEGWTGLRYRK